MLYSIHSSEISQKPWSTILKLTPIHCSEPIAEPTQKNKELAKA